MHYFGWQPGKHLFEANSWTHCLNDSIREGEREALHGMENGCALGGKIAYLKYMCTHTHTQCWLLLDVYWPQYDRLEIVLAWHIAPLDSLPDK